VLYRDHEEEEEEEEERMMFESFPSDPRCGKACGHTYSSKSEM